MKNCLPTVTLPCHTNLSSPWCGGWWLPIAPPMILPLTHSSLLSVFLHFLLLNVWVNYAVEVFSLSLSESYVILVSDFFLLDRIFL